MGWRRAGLRWERIGPGVGIGPLGLVVGPPHTWALPGLCVAAVLAPPGGPMGDVPGAVLRQTALPRDGVPAAMRTYLVANNLGALVGMVVATGVRGLVQCRGVGRRVQAA